MIKLLDILKEVDTSDKTHWQQAHRARPCAAHNRWSTGT